MAATPLESDSSSRFDPELTPLVRLLVRAEGFVLAFVRSNVPVESTRLARSVIDRIGSEGRRGRILHLREPNVDLLQVMRDMKPPMEENESLFVLGFERSIPASDEIAPALARINLVRELFRDLPGPLVLVLPDYALTQLSRQAPDFWAWRSGVFEIEVPEERVEQIFQELAVDDPYRGLSTERKREHRDVLAGLLAELEGGGPGNRKKVQELVSRLAALSLSLREYREAQKLAERALTLAREDEEAEARALDLLAKSSSARGLRKQAVEAAQQSVTIRRRLAEGHSSDRASKLATSLDTFGNSLAARRRFQEALAASQEALEIRRRLAERKADDSFLDLASSLNNTGNHLAQLGRHEEGLRNTQRAVDILRKLAEEHPAAFLPILGRSLISLGARLSEVGRNQDAILATQESIAILRELAKQEPETFLPDVAMSLGNLAIWLSELGRHEEAVQAAHEAVKSLAPACRKLPSSYQAWMRSLLGNYRKLCRATGREPDTDLIRAIKGIFEELD